MPLLTLLYISPIVFPMRVLEIKDISKKNIPLHYRNEFSARAVMELPQHAQPETPMEFSLERSATGDLHIRVQLLEKIDYPLLPAIRRLKDHIRELERRGKLA
jgi:hypothetical protein